MRRAFVLGLVAAAACGSSPLRGGDGAAGGTMAAGGAGGSGGGTSAGAGNVGDGSAGGDGETITDARVNPAMQTDGRCVLLAFKRDGACTCQMTSPDVCGDSCVDLKNDDAHCGACGHACGPSSPCVAGECRPPPQTIGTAPAGCMALDLAATGDLLYWADAGHGTITRLSTGEGMPTVIATGEDRPHTIVARGASVFWVGGAGKQLRRGGLGQAPVTVLASATDIRGLAVTDDAAAVYYSTGADVLRVAAAGGTPDVVAHDANNGNPAAIALAGDRLAFVSDLTHIVYVAALVDGQVAACGARVGDQFDMTSCRMLARGAPKFLEQIAQVPGWAIWAVPPAVVRSESSFTTTLPPNIMIVGSSLVTVTGLAASGTAVYFSDDDLPPASGTIYKVSLVPTGDQIRIARAQRGPRAVTVGAARVFWSNADCTILATNL